MFGSRLFARWMVKLPMLALVAGVSGLQMANAPQALAQTAVQTDRQSDRLYTALDLAGVIDIMQQEGIAYASELETSMFPDRGGAAWQDVLQQIYRVDLMNAHVQGAFAHLLSDKDIQDAIAFFDSDLGVRIVTLEISARRAMLDSDVDATARETAMIAVMDETPRVELLRRFIDENDLIETNVAGAMNSNFAFYQGLIAGGGFDGDLTEDQILNDVWSQEPDIRASTQEWLMAYLLLAYDPLSDEELGQYLAFTQTPAGKAMNTALMRSFNGLFDQISHALGQAAAQQMQAFDL